MLKRTICVTVFVGMCAGLAPAAARAQSCLHDGSESQGERQRRTDALLSVRLVNTAEAAAKRQAAAMRQGGYRPLAELGAFIVFERSDGGGMGVCVASTIDEPRPTTHGNLVAGKTESRTSPRSRLEDK